jgi:hypothetical protein
MLHVRFAAIVGEVLRGSSAGNSKLLFARHICMFFGSSAASTYGRSVFPRIPFL